MKGLGQDLEHTTFDNRSVKHEGNEDTHPKDKKIAG